MSSAPRSLAEVHASVGTAHASIWKRMFAFAGPAYLVSVGYMDPGNWATDLEGGARFGYQLLWVLVMSNLMAILLQTLSARLGIVSGRDLAQACRETYPRPITYALWVLCEIAIAACDLAEVLGAAIGLNLLFHIPLLAGVLLTAADTLLLLFLQSLGIRTLEAFVLSLMTLTGVSFAVEILLARPSMAEVATGLAPSLTAQSLYVAIAMLGATVMPHNLYLHSALVQTRHIGTSIAARRAACRYNLVDSVVALNGALLVNAAILVLAATVFFKRGIVVTEIQQAHLLLAPLLGTSLASTLFGVALLAAGQSSTLTGTMAGQVVMEGFLNLRLRPWLRRLITRMLAVIPAALTIYFAGDKGSYDLLILSQVILSMQLPFAVIPLVHFTSNERRMGAFASKLWVRWLAWIVAAIIVGLNVRLVFLVVGQWLAAAGPYRLLLSILIGVLGAALVLLLLWVAAEPWISRFIRRYGIPLGVPAPPPPAFTVPAYRSILVPLDHSDLDLAAIRHAAGMAKGSAAKVYLMHVEEGVTSRLYGEMASTAEVEAGEEYLEKIAASLRDEGIQVECRVFYSGQPRREIVRYARELRPDLIIMGAHGHGALKDLIFGTTIGPVRHELAVPLLIVRDSGT